MKFAGFYLFLLVLLASSPRWAADSGAGARASDAWQEMNFTLEGKISKLSPGKLTISGEGNIIFHVAYNDKTEIKRKDGSAGTPKDFQVGMRIHVDGDLQESGEIIARRISIQPENADEKR